MARTTIHWDTSEVDTLAADLSAAPGRMQRKAPKVFARGALKIKESLRSDASGHGHLPHLEGTVAYTKFSDLDYEIGFDDVGQGELAAIAVYGSVNNAPVMSSPFEHARRELPFIERALADAGEEAVLGDDDTH